MCPRCGEVVDSTQRISIRDAAWCPECGALVPPGSEHCPKCGRELVTRKQEESRRRMNLPMIDPDDDEGGFDPDDTNFITRIESAIPGTESEDSPGAQHDRMPRPFAFAFAAILALVFVGGSTLLITHPWDPQATQTKATEPADTSMSGFPGVVESLTGQDDDDKGTGQTTATTYETLHGVYEDLGTLSERLDVSEEELRTLVSGSGDTSVDEGLESARSLSISVSNVITKLDRLGYAGGPYDEDVDNLRTLGSWLRNRCDALTSAWELAADAQEPTEVSESVVSLLNGSRDYDRHFSESYEDWEPANRE